MDTLDIMLHRDEEESDRWHKLLRYEVEYKLVAYHTRMVYISTILNDQELNYDAVY